MFLEDSLTTNVPLTKGERAEFANALTHDFDNAMMTFFNAVDTERDRRDHTVEQTRDMLVHGYGEDIAAQWDEWLDN